MDQALTRSGKRTGWSDFENNLLWETAEEAQHQGLPLKAVFERIAQKTGRRPNSIRNYYYAQVRQQEGGQERTARFIPFAGEEVDWLMEQVLRARAQGQSVRSCLQRISDGDHSRMLRYQNKYRSVIKNRPEYVREMVERLNGEGVECDLPQVNHRTRADLTQVCDSMVYGGRRTGDIELVRALETLSRYLQTAPAEGNGPADVVRAAQDLVMPIKDFIARPQEQRRAQVDEFCDELSRRIGELEACLPVEHDVLSPMV